MYRTAVRVHSSLLPLTCCIPFTQLRQRAKVKVIRQLATMPSEQAGPDQLQWRSAAAPAAVDCDTVQ